ncbi:hypothetical protein ACWN8V_11875, partial [Vagococcus elongatus]
MGKKNFLKRALSKETHKVIMRKGKKGWVTKGITLTAVFALGFASPISTVLAVSENVQSSEEVQSTDVAEEQPTNVEEDQSTNVAEEQPTNVEEDQSTNDSLNVTESPAATFSVPNQKSRAQLQQRVDSYEGLVKSSYTPATWKDFANAMKVAKDILAAVEDTTDAGRAAVTDAYNNLFVSFNNLMPLSKVVSKAQLQELVNRSKEKKESLYTPATWKDFADALKVAEDILAADEDPTDAGRAAMKDAYDRLFVSSAQLVDSSKVVSRTQLQELVNRSKEKKESLYTPATWKDFADALKVAEDILAADEDPTDAGRAAMKDAYDRLFVSSVRLVDSSKVVSRTQLQELVNRNQGKEESLYTPATWKDFADALKVAEDILAADEDPTDAGRAAMKDAYDRLFVSSVRLVDSSKVVSRAQLQELVNRNQGKEESLYTPATWKDFADALKVAEDILAADEDPTDAGRVAMKKAYDKLFVSSAQLVDSSKVVSRAQLQELVNRNQ